MKNSHIHSSANGKRIVVLVACLLAACTTSTGIVPIGEETYMIGTTGKSPGGFSGSEAKALAIEEARSFCAAKSRKLQIVNTQQADMRFGVNATAEIQFMCLTDNDPELVRPKLLRSPDQVIQVVTPLSPAIPPSGERTKDLYSELLKLEDLKKRGLLTPAEFEQQKKVILNNQ